jgi:hypothetical protein
MICDTFVPAFARANARSNGRFRVPISRVSIQRASFRADKSHRTINFHREKEGEGQGESIIISANELTYVIPVTPLALNVTTRSTLETPLRGFAGFAAAVKSAKHQRATSGETRFTRRRGFNRRISTTRHDASDFYGSPSPPRRRHSFSRDRIALGKRVAPPQSK